MTNMEHADILAEAIAKELGQALKNELRKEVLTVTFTKTNGEVRNMVCTLRDDLIPMESFSETKGSGRQLSDEVVRVYDLEKEAWRSFRVDSIIDVRKA